MAHIRRGPHDAQFYKLLDELKEETEVLMASGYKGEGFYSDGQQLGTRSVPRYESAKAAALAAEKRLKTSKIMIPAGGVKLGGSTARKHLTPAQQAALAAENRRQDNIWCGGSVIEVEDDDDIPTNNNNKKRRVVKLEDDEVTESTDSNKKPRVIVIDDDDDDKWTCKSCTFLNKSISLICEVCLTEKNTIAENTWTCPQCTLVNDMKGKICVACAYKA